MRRIKSGLGAVVILIAVPVAAAATETARVVTTFKPIHALATQVMAGIGQPELLIEGAASPHTYALRPSDTKRANAADIFVRVSAQMEPFTQRLVRTLSKSVRVVTLEETPGLTLLSKRDSATFETHRHGGKAHAHDRGDKGAARDPHIWLDPDNAKVIVNALARIFAERWPAHRERFEANAAKSVADIDRLAHSLERELAPLRDRPFIVFHDAYQYLERRFGLLAVGSITVSPEVSPSAKRLSEIRRKITELGAVCVFSEPNYEARVTLSVIEGTSAWTAQLDPEGLLTPPGSEHYARMMEALAAGLKGCLAQRP
jgi:zinc transport system substrate-binding protein